MSELGRPIFDMGPFRRDPMFEASVAEKRPPRGRRPLKKATKQRRDDVPLTSLRDCAWPCGGLCLHLTDEKFEERLQWDPFELGNVAWIFFSMTSRGGPFRGGVFPRPRAEPFRAANDLSPAETPVSNNGGGENFLAGRRMICRLNEGKRCFTDAQALTGPSTVIFLAGVVLRRR